MAAWRKALHLRVCRLRQADLGHRGYHYARFEVAADGLVLGGLSHGHPTGCGGPSPISYAACCGTLKSETHKAFGRGARNWRFTRSSGHGVERSLTVVRTGLPRTTPASPISPIRRATVQRAIVKPSRSNWRQSLRTP